MLLSTHDSEILEWDYEGIAILKTLDTQRKGDENGFRNFISQMSALQVQG